MKRHGGVSVVEMRASEWSEESQRRMAGGLGKGGMDGIVLRAVFTLESGREGVSEWMLK